MKKYIGILFFLFFTLFFSSCSQKKAKDNSDSNKIPSIAVFIPGIIADSPTYAHVVQGVQEAVKEKGGNKVADLYIMEAGTNQSEWSNKLTALAAGGQYDLIVSSNPSLPELASPIAIQFPEQKFIFLDAALPGNIDEELANHFYCVSYNQRDQAYVSGYMAGLYSKSHKVGLIAAQEYPIMNNILYPYFAKGAADAFEGTTCDFRIVGNWYDASKGAELALAMNAVGVDVILPICGGASQGVISAAIEKGMHITWFDENGFEKAAGTIISCCMTDQALAAKEAVTDYLEGKSPWGATRTLGMADGYVRYFEDDKSYIENVDSEIRNKMSALVKELESGQRKLPQSLK